MNHNITIYTLFLLSAGLIAGCTPSTTSQSETPVNSVASQTNLPDRPAEINGVVKIIEGNEVIVINELREVISDEDRAIKQAERQNLSQEEKQALRQEELEQVETEQLTIMIPVGAPIVSGSGTGDGTNVSAQMSDIKSGSYISIWKTGDTVEFVKLKGVN